MTARPGRVTSHPSAVSSRQRDQAASAHRLPDLQPGPRLSEQVGDALATGIRAGRLAAGERLPSEQALGERFGVSRTVIREALTRLKSQGLVVSRQGSGVYVGAGADVLPLRLDVQRGQPMAALVQIIEMRRALEAETAGLAAARRTPADARRIRAALVALDAAVAHGGDGVAEDVALHRAIAAAAANPFLLATLEYLGQFLADGIRVTRANEATRVDFARQVRAEHAAVVAAIVAGDVGRARRAGALHMANAAKRIGSCDPAFWARHGQRLAERLVAELGSAGKPRANVACRAKVV